ncbi:hypothetical protein B0H14DRAFT_2622424 [Mycena olivaceomarginata]|nr:hypothetical protein B0H14DRAFT_2622424 [Mycena olivaceomarginata]
MPLAYTKEDLPRLRHWTARMSGLGWSGELRRMLERDNGDGKKDSESTPVTTSSRVSAVPQCLLATVTPAQQSPQHGQGTERFCQPRVTRSSEQNPKATFENPRLQRQNQAKRQGKDFKAGIDGGRASQKVVWATWEREQVTS